MLDSETSTHEFEPVNYQQIKGFSNKSTYTYTFMPGTTISGGYSFDMTTGYKLRTTVDKKDVGVTVVKAPKNYYTFAPELNVITNGYWRNSFVSPYFTLTATWTVIPFYFKPLNYEVKIPVIG